MAYESTNKYPHKCHPDARTCTECMHVDIGERAAIMTDGQPVSAYEKAVALLMERRRPGQRALLAG